MFLVVSFRAIGCKNVAAAVGLNFLDVTLTTHIA